MTEEQLEKARPYLAGDELKARYPDVDFDHQGANPPRLDYVSDVVRLHGRDQAFLLALIFSGKDSIDCCKILRRVIKDFRHYIVASYRAGVPFEEVEVVNVDELRRIVYKVFPETNTMDMYIKLLNDNEALTAEIAALREEVAVLKAMPVQAQAPQPPKGGEEKHPLQGDGGLPEDDRPATKEDLYAYYSERALAALKKAKPKLMSSLALALPDKDARSMFIDSLPAPNDCDELVNTLFRPACDCGAMKPLIARGLTWSEYILDLLDFPKPVKARQLNNKIKAFFDEYLLKNK